METPILKINNVSKVFDNETKPALNNISTQVFSGKMTGLVGPDGAGKTTLIRLITGLMKYEQGEIFVDGLLVASAIEEVHRITGYMPQKFGLYEDLSVIENLNLYADLRELHGEARKLKFEKLLKFSDLEEFRERLAGKLSGGMKQKLGLACALLGEPKLLLLDEPSVGVDPISRRELWSMVQDLLADGMGVLWSTSYLDEAEKCDDVILLNEGNLLFNGHPYDILKRVEGRTFQIINQEASQKRKILLECLKKDNVIDGIIQGDAIRLVLKDKSSDLGGYQGDIIAVNPSFEDAFVDILGGGPGGESVLADNIQAKAHSDKPVVVAKNLSKTFGDFKAVQNNNFEIYSGEIFGLLGPNGAGKSTTFKMMCGLLQPTEGEAYISGNSLSKATEQARLRIGYMAQKFSLYGNLNVRQNLEFFSGLYDLKGKLQKEKVEMMIDIFDFKNFVKTNAGALPLGFKQRLALACAVMHEPDVLFLDEPTSGVDPITRREFWTHINSLAEKGVTIMITTHFMDEAEYCDRIGLIYKGKSIATGSPEALKQSVKSETLPNPSLEDAFIHLVENSDAIR